MDCARFLVAESITKGIPLPQIFVHSANPIGSHNIMGYINNYLRNQRLPETCVRASVSHTYTKFLSEEERNARYKIMKRG